MRIETDRLVLVPHGTAFLESTHAYASDQAMAEAELGWILNETYWK